MAWCSYALETWNSGRVAKSKRFFLFFQVLIKVCDAPLEGPPFVVNHHLLVDFKAEVRELLFKYISLHDCVKLVSLVLVKLRNIEVKIRVRKGL